MKVFVSSLIAGFGPFRQAARTAITTLRHEPVMAEDFGAQPNSPQVACLTGLRASDVAVLVLGEHYGAKQQGSGLSATHEEYRDAKGRKPVIAFVQDGIADPDQAAFISEVQGWEGGLYRGAFHDAADLQQGVTRALHDYELTKVTGPVDAEALIKQACALLPRSDRNSYSGSAVINVAVSGGPSQQILRPVELEAPALADDLHQAALFGTDTRIFDRSKGGKTGIDGAALVLAQEEGARVRLDEQGTLQISLPLDQDRQRGGSAYNSLPVLIEEVVQRQLAAALAYAGWALEHIDPTQRLTHVGIAAAITGADHLAWRTQREHDASPRSVSMGMSSGRFRDPISLSRPRAALRLDRAHLVEDLLVPLRRQLKS